MIERVTDFLRDLSRRQEAAVLIVAHGGIGYCFDHLLTDTELPQVALNGQVQHYTLSNKKE
jgi:broad specificity phosphatase PhoE